MTLTKRDLVMRISEETGLVQQDVYTVLQRTLDYIMEALAGGENVEFRNFGVFEVQERKARIGRNPNKPTDVVTIPPRKVVKFKSGKIMKEMISRQSPMGNAAPSPAQGPGADHPVL
jgi:nucleoid DNA-binding protein